MSKGKGYRLPEEPDPQDYYCLKVFIPKDEIYLYAFSGSFQYLSKWVAWEKDTTGRATIAAQRWKEAYQYTLDNGWLNCEADCPDCPEEDEMTTVINNINCGGCGCGGGSSDTINVYNPPGNTNCIPLPTTGDDEPIPPPPAQPTEPPEPYFPDDPNWENQTAWQEARCRIANWGWRLVNGVLEAIANANETSQQMGVILAFLVTVIPYSLFARISPSRLIAMLQAISGLANIIPSGLSDLFGEMRTWWQENQADIVCTAYNAFDSVAISDYIQDNIIPAIVDVLDIEGWSDEAIEFASLIMSAFFSPGLMSLLWNFNAPGWATEDIDCSICGETEYNYELRDKDGGLIASHSAFTGQTVNVPTSENAPGSGGGSLILLRFYNAAMELKNVTGNLTSSTGHVNPTNANHPFTVQYSIQDGAQNVVLIGLNNPIPVPTAIAGYHQFYLHGLNQFQVSFVIDSISA